MTVAQHKIDSLETIALDNISAANKIFNDAVLRKNVDQYCLEKMDSLYRNSKRQYGSD